MATTRDAQREVLEAHRSPSVLPPTKVRLRVWGFTRADVARAELVAQGMPRVAFWEIAEVIPSVGGACPIPPGDTSAFDQGSDYDWAWAVYLAGADAG